MSKEKSTNERKSSLRKGCLFTLVGLLLLPFICYGGIWVFAHFGGRLVSTDLPVPSESELISTSFLLDEYYYNYEYNLYAHTASPEDLKSWYRLEGFILNEISIPEDIRLYSTYSPMQVESGLFEIHKLTAWIVGWFDEMAAPCHNVSIYRPDSDLSTNFDISNQNPNMTYFSVKKCWINADY
ncbi:MAG: hypothetical protein AAF846_00480 [Chloroflexota bacterium]